MNKKMKKAWELKTHKKMEVEREEGGSKGGRIKEREWRREYEWESKENRVKKDNKGKRMK